ncbi:MAG: FlgD immunoglobulin-like domain containing protein [Candidatus Latescibacterota bacterium]
MLLDQARPAGIYSIAWDGRDSAGQEVASGVYLCWLAAGRDRLVRKMGLVR